MTARPLILFVSAVPDLKGGAERVLLDMFGNPAIRPALAVPADGELAEIARGRGVPVRLFELGKVGTVRRPVTPAAMSRAVGDSFRAVRQIAAAARALGAAAVHTNGLKVHVLGALACILGQVRVLAHLHDIPHTRLERTVWRAIGTGVSRVVTVSAPCWPGPLGRRAAVVMNGSARPPAGTPRNARGPLTLGFVGRFHPFKGLHTLLDWIDAMPPDLAGRVSLVVRGRAAEESLAYWQGLQTRIEAMAPHCRYEGWMGGDRDAFDGLDLLVVPSVMPDPAPLVVMEAMLAGIPVLGYDAGGIPMLLGGTGRLVTGAPSFHAALRDMLDPEIYACESAAALQRATADFSLTAFWGRLNAQYRLLGVQVPEALA